MIKHYRALLQLLFAGIAFCTLRPDAAGAATRVEQFVSGATPIELFTFATAAGMPPGNHMVVANLLVNEAMADLVFVLDVAGTPDPFFTPVAFSTTTNPADALFGIRPLTDDNMMTVFEVRAQDLGPSLPAANRPVAGYRIIKLRIAFRNNYMFPAKTWSVRATPLAEQKRYTGFWSEGDGPDDVAVENALTAENGRPIIELLGADTDGEIGDLDFGRLQTNLNNELGHIAYYRVSNVGTAPLHPPTLPPTVSPPFSISPLDYSWGARIRPGGVSGLKADMPTADNIVSFKFRPTAIGPASQTVQIGGRWEDADGDLQPLPAGELADLTLVGEGVTTDMIALLDASGSMCFPYSGGSGPADCAPNPRQSRIYQAKQSISITYDSYLELIRGSDARYGLYTFPTWNLPEPPWTGGQATAAPYLDLMRASDHETAVDMAVPLTGGIQPVFHGTPMAEGISVAYNDLPGGNRLGYIVLFSDGDHNTDSPPPRETPQEWLSTLLADDIQVLPIAYGEPGSPGQTATNHQLMQYFACTQIPGISEAECLEAPQGEYFAVASGDPVDVAGIKKVFERVTGRLMGLNPVVDPKATLAANQNAAHDVCIEDSAQTMTVILDWDESQTNAIGLTLRGPHGQNLTRTSPGVAYSESETGVTFLVKPQHMVGGMGGGIWRLNLDGNNRAPLDYNYSVFTQGPDKVTTNLTSIGLTTRGALPVELDLREVFALRRGSPQTLQVYLEVTSPGRSYGTYLADRDFDVRYLVGGAERVAPEIIAGERASMWARKQYVLENFLSRRFVQVWGNNRNNFVDDGTNGDRTAGDHIYTAQTPALSVDGKYEFHIVIDGAWNGGCIQRDIRVTRYIPVALPPTVIDTGIGVTNTGVTALFPAELATQLSIPAPSGTVRQSVVFEPQDEFGNKLGPGHASEIAISFNGAEGLGAIIDNLDGRYEQVFQYPQGTDPQITVAVAGRSASVALSSRPGYVPPPQTTLPSWWLWVVLAAVVIVILAVLLRRRAGP